MRLIDADVASRWMEQNDAYMDAEILRAIPTVDAEVVVRCKDCKHYGMGACLKIYSDGNVHSAAWQGRKPEDFCSYGERKDKADAKG